MFTSTKTLLTSALAAAAAVAPASAYITAMEASSSSVAAGSSVPVTFTTGIYIQNWSDLGAVWGIKPVSSAKSKRADDVYVGTMVDYTDLYKKGVEPEEPGNFTVQVKIPEETSAGEYTLTAGVSFLVGASGLTSVQSWNDTITVTKA